MQIVRFRTLQGAVRLGVREPNGHLDALRAADITLADLLRLSEDELRQLPSSTQRESLPDDAPVALLAPIDRATEVWAAGVTYRRSEQARMEESQTPDIYSKVYAADRPELFFKASPRRVAGPDEPIAIRSDSAWDVPEPELAIVVNAHARIVGYTIANDVSSRSIEGENPLYLPQAKVFAGCCALGPGVVPAWEVPDPYRLGIHMRILRNDELVWQGETSTSELKRRLDELVRYLFLEDDFPDGVIVCTGTALVPASPFTLAAGDEVEIEIDQLGTLRNPVVSGKAARAAWPDARA
jgi:2-dehydro-3-deoxy-D-arabinonate dehydratase